MREFAVDKESDRVEWLKMLQDSQKTAASTEQFTQINSLKQVESTLMLPPHHCFDPCVDSHVSMSLC